MRFTILTLFPEFFDSALRCGLMGKAAEDGVVSFSFVNPRDFTTDRHRTVDDRPYGGGPGMVMTLEPLCRALESLCPSDRLPGRILLPSPAGRPFDQAMARELAGKESITLVCGRYEGVDARLNDLFPITPVSIGDFVINGGETAALCVTEAVARLLPGFMGKAESADEESFSAGLLEHPHYTRPESFRGLDVPPVLLSGDHARIAARRRELSLAATLRERPDLLAEAPLDDRDAAFLQSCGRARLGRNLHVALVHGPVRNKKGEIGTVSLTNIDIHDIARVSRTYGLAGYHLVTPLRDQQGLAERVLRHWREGAGSRANPDRADAMGTVDVFPDLDSVVSAAAEKHGTRPFIAATSAGWARTTSMRRMRRILDQRPVLLVLGTGSGLAPEIMDRADGVLPPIRPFNGYNHLSVRSAASILMDRLLGDVY